MSSTDHSGPELESPPHQLSSADSLSPHNVSQQQIIGHSLAEKGPPGDTQGPKRRRACEPCRRLKVHCHYDSSTITICKRCIKFGRECEVTPRRRRHLTVKSDPSSELEKKIEVLAANLEAIKGSASTNNIYSSLSRIDRSSTGSEKATTSVPQDPLPELRKPNSVRDPLDLYEKVSIPRGTPSVTIPAAQFKHITPLNQSDIASKRIAQPSDIFRDDSISIKAAGAAYEHFVKFMLPHFPIIEIPQTMTAITCLENKPILFLAIATAASRIFPTETQRELHARLTRILAERILMVGEKSLELIQAVQIASIWNHPPARHEALKHYQLIHNAGIIAIDMGLNRRSIGSKRGTDLVDHTGKTPCRAPGLDPSASECRRAWLGCYFLASQTAQNLRRENLIRWSTWLEDCLRHFEDAEDARPSDKILCHWVRLQHLVDSVSTHLFIEDPSACKSLDEIGVQLTIKGLDSELDRTCTRSLDRPVTLQLGEVITRLYTHEVALHAGSTVESDMQPPFTEAAFKGILPTQAEQLSAAHIASLSTVLTSIHQTFALFLSIPVTDLQYLPTFQFVRMVYAAVVLIKIGINATIPSSAISRMFSLEDFKIESNLDRLIILLKEAAMGGCCPNAVKFRLVIGVLRSIYLKQILRKPMSGSAGFTPSQHNSTLHPALQQSSTSARTSGRTGEEYSKLNASDENDILKLLSDAAAAEQQTLGITSSLSLPSDTIMSDVFDFQSMDFNLDSANFEDLFSGDFATVISGSGVSGATGIQNEYIDG